MTAHDLNDRVAHDVTHDVTLQDPGDVALVCPLLATSLTTVLLTTATRLTAGSTERSADPERGDVPGWVMVTLMTAGLVAIVWVLADDWLRQLFQQAVDRVSGP